MFQPCYFGKYYLYERLAVGGMAEIYRAKLYGVDGFEKNMVVKQILPQYAKHQEFIQMFIDEAKICVNLSHGNIVPVYELGEIDGIYFISMEFVDGKNLGELLDFGLDAEQPLSVPHALYIACEMLSGLDYAHRKNDEKGQPLNIVHRDVSPQNVLISYEGEVQIVDFGIARAATKVHATEAGVIKGKFGYMSPEQAIGKPVDARSDVFAAGILFYEMLTLERLFHAGTDVVTLERVKRADVPTPSRTNPNLPPQLDAIVFRALARNPQDRYQSAGEMRLAISRFMYKLPQEASSKTLAAYLKQLFAKELAQRINQPKIVAPPAEQAQPVAPPQPGPGNVQSQASAAAPGNLFGDDGRPIASFDSGPGYSVSDQAQVGLDDDLDVSFSYAGAGNKLKWIIILGFLATVVVLGIVFKSEISRLFTTISEVVDESAERLAQKDLGTLFIRSRPSGAAVYFDNRKVGTTNMRIGKIDPEREYEVVLTMEGFPPWSRRLLPSDWKQGGKMEIQVYKDWTADSFKK
ncbi:MAG: serine/threonine protein kinase [Deltaproteobacteria bacterium]|nr:serine/threonine protein kinase [Deltaproteobacteria bacterium]